jgi:hypothetical protein
MLRVLEDEIKRLEVVIQVGEGDLLQRQQFC